MNFFKLLLPIALLTLAAASGCWWDSTELQYPPTNTCDTLSVTYVNTVENILSTSCTGCHGASFPSADIDLSSYNAVKAYIGSSGSTFYNSIAHIGADENKFMPQGGTKLEDCKIRKIQAWINAGMPQQ